MSYHTKLTTAALAVAQADWGNEDTPRAERPKCLEVSEEMRAIWTSEDPAVKAAAAKECLGCPKRRRCVRDAMDSQAVAGIYGAFDLAAATGRRAALVWLGDIEAKPRRRSPNRTQVAS